jgi:hypothetical protein
MLSKGNDRELAENGTDVQRGSQLTNRFRTHTSHEAHSRIFFLLLPLIFFSLLISGCPLYNPAAFVENPSKPEDVLSAATQVTLAWNPPASGASPASYVVSYRVHGTSAWTTLAMVAASPQPTYTVLRSVVGAGSFDFAVATVDSTGDTSPVHSSLDSTADPTTGWYLTW